MQVEVIGIHNGSPFEQPVETVMISQALFPLILRVDKTLKVTRNLQVSRGLEHRIGCHCCRGTLIESCRVTTSHPHSAIGAYVDCTVIPCSPIPIVGGIFHIGCVPTVVLKCYGCRTLTHIVESNRGYIVVYRVRCRSGSGQFLIVIVYRLQIGIHIDNLGELACRRLFALRVVILDLGKYPIGIIEEIELSQSRIREFAEHHPTFYLLRILVKHIGNVPAPIFVIEGTVRPIQATVIHKTHIGFCEVPR